MKQPGCISDVLKSSCVLKECHLTVSEHVFHLQASEASVQVVELPVVTAPIHSSFFVLPNFSDVFPLLPTDIDYILQKKVGGITDLTVGYVAIVFTQPLRHSHVTVCTWLPNYALGQSCASEANTNTYLYIQVCIYVLRQTRGITGCFGDKSF